MLLLQLLSDTVTNLIKSYLNDLFVYLQLIWARNSKFVERSPQSAFWRKNFNSKDKDANTFWL